MSQRRAGNACSPQTSPRTTEERLQSLGEASARVPVPRVLQVERTCLQVQGNSVTVIAVGDIRLNDDDE